jgi:hypothetical protein
VVALYTYLTGMNTNASAGAENLLNRCKTNNAKLTYLRKSGSGMFLQFVFFIILTIPNAYLFLCFPFLLLIIKPAQKTHSIEELKLVGNISLCRFRKIWCLISLTNQVEFHDMFFSIRHTWLKNIKIHQDKMIYDTIVNKSMEHIEEAISEIKNFDDLILCFTENAGFVKISSRIVRILLMKTTTLNGYLWNYYEKTREIRVLVSKFQESSTRLMIWWCKFDYSVWFFHFTCTRQNYLNWSLKT